MQDKIILCVDLQRWFLPEIEGGRLKGQRNVRPWEGDHRAWDAPNAFIQKAAKAGIPTWYVAWRPDPRLGIPDPNYLGVPDPNYSWVPAPNHRNVSFIVGNADWAELEKRFQHPNFGGFSRLHMTVGSPVFFKERDTLFEHPRFLADLESQGVKEMSVIGCDTTECVPANSLHGVRHGLAVNIIQNHVFGSEMELMPPLIEDKDEMRKAINEFRASEGRKQQIALDLKDKCTRMGFSHSLIDGIEIVTEECLFSRPNTLPASRPRVGMLQA